MSLNENMKSLILYFLILLPAFSLASDEVPENIVSIEEGSVEIREGNGAAEITLGLTIKEKFFAYKEKFEVNIAGFTTQSVTLDPIITFYDKTFQKNKEGVRNTAKLTALIQFHGKNLPKDLAIDLVYQACTPEYCLFPTTTSIHHALTSHEHKILSRNGKRPDWFAKGLLFSFLFVFIAGFLTSLTPCIYPMLPITLAVLGARKTKSKREGFLKSAIYVLGMAVTYSILGVLAATSGFMFGSLLSNSYFLIFLCGILFIAALSMFDVFEIQTPQFLQSRIGEKGHSTSHIAIFGSGLFSGLIVGPCVGPVLVGILGYVSQAGNIVLGFSLLFTFAIGLGSLIILVGTFSSLFERIPRAGSWMILVKKIIGLAFLGLIIYFISPLFKTKDLALICFGTFFIFSIIHLFKDFKDKHLSVLERAIWRSSVLLSILLFVFAFFSSHERFERLVGFDGSHFANTHWNLYSEENLAIAAQHQDVVVLDFYAEWCAACRELKHKTFADPRVSNYSNKIKWLYFDSTQSTDELSALKKKYGILGLPTILFFDNTGKWRDDLTLTGFEDADSFIQRLNKLTGEQK